MNLIFLILYRAWSSVIRKLRAMAEARSKNNLAAGAVQVAVQVSGCAEHKHTSQINRMVCCSLRGLVQSFMAASYLWSLWPRPWILPV